MMKMVTWISGLQEADVNYDARISALEENIYTSKLSSLYKYNLERMGQSRNFKLKISAKVVRWI